MVTEVSGDDETWGSDGDDEWKLIMLVVNVMNGGV